MTNTMSGSGRWPRLLEITALWMLTSYALAVCLCLVGCDPPADDDSAGDDDTAVGDDDTAVGDGMNMFDCMGTGGDPGEWDWDEGNCPTDCAGNTAPVLGTPFTMVNGVIQDAGTAATGDLLEAFIEYEDAECNAACGTLYMSFMTPTMGEDSGGALPANWPCSTSASSWHLGFDFGAAESGEYAYSLRLIDYCGAESGLAEGAFTIL